MFSGGNFTFQERERKDWWILSTLHVQGIFLTLLASLKAGLQSIFHPRDEPLSQRALRRWLKVAAQQCSAEARLPSAPCISGPRICSARDAAGLQRVLSGHDLTLSSQHPRESYYRLLFLQCWKRRHGEVKGL